MSIEFHGTTICAVKKDGKTAIAGDGQVTLSQSVIFKNNAVKVRRIYNGKVILGFAGSVSDAFTLSERFEEMLNKYSGNLTISRIFLCRAVHSAPRHKIRWTYSSTATACLTQQHILNHKHWTDEQTVPHKWNTDSKTPSTPQMPAKPRASSPTDGFAYSAMP